jgi:hypothetical protein
LKRNLRRNSFPRLPKEKEEKVVETAAEAVNKVEAEKGAAVEDKAAEQVEEEKA